MLCKQCNSSVPDGSKFCPKCGTPIAQVPPQANGGPGYFRSGNSFEDFPSSQVPPQQPAAPASPAGQPQSAPVQPQPGGYGYPSYAAVYEPPKKKSHKGLIIGIVAFLLIAAIAAVAAFFLLSDDDEDSSSKNSSSHSSTKDDDEDEDSDSEDKDSDDEDKDSDNEDKDSDDEDKDSDAKASKNRREPEEVAEDFMSYIFSGDLDEAFELVPEDVMAEANGDVDDLADELEPVYEEMDEYGIKVSVKALYYKSLDDDEIEELQNAYEDEFDVKLDISGANTVELEMTAAGEVDGEEVEESTNVSLVVIKVDGDWYVDVLSLENAF